MKRVPGGLVLGPSFPLPAMNPQNRPGPGCGLQPSKLQPMRPGRVTQHDSRSSSFKALEGGFAGVFTLPLGRATWPPVPTKATLQVPARPTQGISGPRVSKQLPGPRAHLPKLLTLLSGLLYACPSSRWGEGVGGSEARHHWANPCPLGHPTRWTSHLRSNMGTPPTPPPILVSPERPGHQPLHVAQVLPCT